MRPQRSLCDTIRCTATTIASWTARFLDCVVVADCKGMPRGSSATRSPCHSILAPIATASCSEGKAQASGRLGVAWRRRRNRPSTLRQLAVTSITTSTVCSESRGRNAFLGSRQGLLPPGRHLLTPCPSGHTLAAINIAPLTTIATLIAATLRLQPHRPGTPHHHHHHHVGSGGVLRRAKETTLSTEMPPLKRPAKAAQPICAAASANQSSEVQAEAFPHSARIPGRPSRSGLPSLR